MEDCICAIASAVGGGIAVIRMSGEGAFSLADNCWISCKGRKLSEEPARYLSLGCFYSGEEVIDPQCLAVRMCAPNSYTGEDVVEFHCHGGALCARSILQILLQKGARLAEPGEFTRRAFCNGKMDLTQAEAVSDMITAGSDAALRMAGRQLSGVIGEKVRQLQEELDHIRAEVESRLDFPEEELDFQPAESLRSKVEGVRLAFEKLAATRKAGEILRGGVSTVIIGAPNAGKSSLLNWLLGRNRAIVSAIPGTTRDTIEEMVQIRGIPFRLVDTAGIRNEVSDSIESAGMERSRSAAESADLVLWIYDSSRPAELQSSLREWKFQGTVLRVANKSDLLTESERDACRAAGGILISVKEELGMDALQETMEQAVLQHSLESMEIAVSARHGAIFQNAAEKLKKAVDALQAEQWEIAAIPLRAAVLDLGVVTGKYAAPDVLDEIFSRFCIGK